MGIHPNQITFSHKPMVQHLVGLNARIDELHEHVQKEDRQRRTDYRAYVDRLNPNNTSGFPFSNITLEQGRDFF